MKKFRFGAMMRKYNTTYTAVRKATGSRNEDGDWIPAGPERVALKGHIQPVSERLMQAEAGRYTSDDRMLYTLNTHEADERIDYQGIQYIVSEPKEREYSDVNQYVLTKVVANDPV